LKKLRFSWEEVGKNSPFAGGKNEKQLRKGGNPSRREEKRPPYCEEGVEDDAAEKEKLRKKKYPFTSIFS